MSDEYYFLEEQLYLQKFATYSPSLSATGLLGKTVHRYSCHIKKKNSTLRKEFDRVLYV